jgi:hypothetical protein
VLGIGSDKTDAVSESSLANVAYRINGGSTMRYGESIAKAAVVRLSGSNWRKEVRYLATVWSANVVNDRLTLRGKAVSQDGRPCGSFLPRVGRVDLVPRLESVYILDATHQAGQSHLSKTCEA